MLLIENQPCNLYSRVYVSRCPDGRTVQRRTARAPRLLAGRKLPGRGQIYLLNNPLLKEPLRLEHVKPRLLGHWGTTPGLNFIYVHCNRLIRRNDSEHDLHMRSRAWWSGRGREHVAGRLLHGVLSRHHARRGRDEAALQAIFVSGRHSESCSAGDARLHT
jgi:phosphoketolase